MYVCNNISLVKLDSKPKLTNTRRVTNKQEQLQRTTHNLRMQAQLAQITTILRPRRATGSVGGVVKLKTKA